MFGCHHSCSTSKQESDSSDLLPPSAFSDSEFNSSVCCLGRCRCCCYSLSNSEPRLTGSKDSDLDAMVVMTFLRLLVLLEVTDLLSGKTFGGYNCLVFEESGLESNMSTTRWADFIAGLILPSALFCCDGSTLELSRSCLMLS